MMGRTIGDRLALYLPPGASVRHKTGTLLGAEGVSVNDVGYVTRPNGAVVVMAVFIKNSPESVAHATRDKVIGHVARAIYDDIQLRDPVSSRRPRELMPQAPRCVTLCAPQ